MPSSPTTHTAPAAFDPATSPAADTRGSLITVAVLTALVAVPLGVSLGMKWVDLPWNEPDRALPAPDWVALPVVRATTADGTVVKARVALDVPTRAARSAIQRNQQQVGLLLEVSVAQQTREQIGSAQGIPRLADDMRERLNDYLGGATSQGAAPAVKSVAIQDLLVKPQ